MISRHPGKETRRKSLMIWWEAALATAKLDEGEQIPVGRWCYSWLRDGYFPSGCGLLVLMFFWDLYIFFTLSDLYKVFLVG